MPWGAGSVAIHSMPVIDNDNLDIGISLCQSGLQRFGDEASIIIVRYQQGDQWKNLLTHPIAFFTISANALNEKYASMASWA